jgi:hypothetical protein
MMHATKAFDIMRYVYKNGLTSMSPTANIGVGEGAAEAARPTLKVTLRVHQQAVLSSMERLEKAACEGIDCSGELFYSSYGILGDSVGVGKSLMVMGHILRLIEKGADPIQSTTSISAHSTGHTFSIRRTHFTDVSEAGCILIVPHTLFRQWSQYIKQQSTIKTLFLEKKKCLTEETLARDVLDSQLVLISNTLYKEFSCWVEQKQIRWKRAFIDEADTIHITSGYPVPKARFTWLITASWMNVIFPNETIYVSNNTLNSVIFSATNTKYKCLQPYFMEAHMSNRTYNYFRFGVTSYSFLRNILNAEHPLRGGLVVRCSDDFIRESISLPQLVRTNIFCKAPLQSRIVSECVPTEIQHLLHAGDTAGAIQALGVKTEDTTSIVEAVTKNLQKELSRLRATHTFKESLEYSSPAAKATALSSLEDKIRRVEENIAGLKQRIEGFKDEVCPICYDEPGESALITPCCSHVFCGRCILTCLSNVAACPMCREKLGPKGLRHVVKEQARNEIIEAGAAEEPQEILEKKPDALLRVFRENPQGRFLVFSRYDNPFTEMETQLETTGVRVKQMKGNKDAVAATLRSFQSGDLRCLLLNSHYAGAGLNITAATHVILLHAMTHEEEKQILGRAYRMGRTEPLNFIRLLHENESVNTTM